MKRMSGLAAVELTAFAAVVSVLGIGLGMEATQHLGAAERRHMESQARFIGGALQMRVANLVAQGREAEIDALARDNPVQWLPVPPENYLGERDLAPERGEALGTWYFDRSRQELVYRVRRGSRFLPDSGGEPQVRFRTEVVRDERADGWNVVGVVFKPVTSYQWR